jgi:hypothetical protein
LPQLLLAQMRPLRLQLPLERLNSSSQWPLIMPWHSRPRLEAVLMLTELVVAVQACLKELSGAAVLFPLLQLPWAQRLPAAVVKCLLLAAAERQAKSTFDRLMQLTQAPRDDAEVQEYADIIRFCSGPAALSDAKEERWDVHNHKAGLNVGERGGAGLNGDSGWFTPTELHGPGVGMESAESSGSACVEEGNGRPNAVYTGCIWPPPDYQRDWSE